ncbi:MAG: DUF4340 domain-containing protein [Candidatus Aminicenantes bacterium]|nr:DUF4340 domain-containing protein [Candidatus Aminicenantes bacterium]
MKFKTTLILLLVFIILLAGVVFIEHTSNKAKEKKEKEEKLTDFKAAEVEKISLKAEGQETITLQKDEKGNWQIIEPLVAEADNYEANSLAENFASLRIEHVVENQATDLKAYEIPKKEISLWVKGQKEPVKILIGMENPLDSTLYAKRADQAKVVLLPSYIKYSLDKKLFDLRNKEILKFETKEVQAIEVKSKDLTWKASRKGDSWILVQPVEALASNYQIDNLLDNLSRLKAKNFVVEEKKPEDLKSFGLDQPEFTVNLTLPESKELVFQLTKKNDKVIATNSISKKIIEVDSQIINDLNKKINDLREKKVAVFNSWEVIGITIKQQDKVIAAAKEKIKEKGQEQEKWLVLGEANKKEPADESKIESLIRKLEYLEAIEFIDRPANLSDFGLDNPRVKITLKVKPQDKEEKEIHLLVGQETPDKKQVIIKNNELSYLFRVDSSFLTELPAKPEDWKYVENKK